MAELPRLDDVGKIGSTGTGSAVMAPPISSHSMCRQSEASGEGDASVSGEDSGGGGSEGGGSESEESGDGDDEGEPPIQVWLILALISLACTILILAPHLRFFLGETLKALSGILSLPGAVGGLRWWLHCYRKHGYKNHPIRRAALDSLGGAVVGSFFSLPILCLPAETVAFLFGLRWPTVVSFAKRIVDRLLDNLMS